MQELLKWLKQAPNKIISAISLISTIIAFVILINGNLVIGIISITAITLLATWFIFFYLAFNKTEPLLLGGKGVYKYQRLRGFSLTMLIAIPLIALLLLSFSTNRAYIAYAIIGSPTHTPTSTYTSPPTASFTSTGVLVFGGTAFPAQTETALPTTTSMPAESQILHGKIANNTFAWVEYPNLPATIGSDNDIEIAGEYLGRLPWVLIDFRVMNPSDKQQTISVILNTIAYEKIDIPNNVLTINCDYAPSNLLPTSGKELGTPSPFGMKLFEPQEGEHFVGVISEKVNDDVPLISGQNSPPSYLIPAFGLSKYVAFISANRPGKYEFMLELRLLTTDNVESFQLLGTYKYAFLDYETAHNFSKVYIGENCP